MASRSGSGILNQGKPDEFPILCDSCLGSNPLVRMQRMDAAHSTACKICERPYNSYRWKPSQHGRYKKTEICITCAKLKNVCQTCILDLQYHLPVQVRDSVLSAHQKIQLPSSTVQKNWMIEQFERNQETIEHAGGDSNQSLYQPLQSNTILSKLQRHTTTTTTTTTNNHRNDSKPCTYYVRGECNRGNACSYSHDAPSHDSTLAKQSITDRYNGKNDPVALKLLNNQSNNARHHNASSAASIAPDDQSITTLFIGSIDPCVSDQQLHDALTVYGEIDKLTVLHDKNIAFVQYHTRVAAEEAIQKLHSNFIINDKKLKIDWTKSKKLNSSQQPTDINNTTKKQKTSIVPPPGINLPPGTNV